MRVKWGMVCVLLLGAITVNLGTGSTPIALSEVFDLLGQGFDAAKRSQSGQIIWLFRLPKALVATLAGSALAVSGLQMQTLFQNPLADPFVLGVSAGASLGAALAIVLGGTWLGAWGLIGAAMGGDDHQFTGGLDGLSAAPKSGLVGFWVAAGLRGGSSAINFVAIWSSRANSAVYFVVRRQLWGGNVA
ncbi:MAG: iron ABC transporter permease [Oscillatoriales cyanobacterium SM2_2_1]|nr:iron ABC transporter permease [Oscillatoriales cyanobacterium SM2_2_1]